MSHLRTSWSALDSGLGYKKIKSKSTGFDFIDLSQSKIYFFLKNNY